jgi:hypothetical protein
MSWKSIACVAALGAMSAPALALPSISVVKTSATTGRIDVITTAAGSIGAEVSLVLAGATLNSAVVNSAIFDTANPGDNPFIAGSPVGGDTTGMSAVTGGTSIFASFGSGNQPAGTYKLLDFTFSGASPTATATGDGFVASVGVLTNVPADVEVIGMPAGIFGDFEPDGDVDIIDFGLFADTFGKVTGNPGFDVRGDSEPDGDVDIIDFGLFADNFGTGTSSAVSVPEPTAALLGLIGVACLGFRRV